VPCNLGVHKCCIDENNLRTFERQIPRKIFGPVNIDNIWRILNNMEIDKLIEGADIV
jgi:ribosomal protein S28E/S33